ncbi:MAG TPA: hypothetical protein VL198_04240 [Pseudolabrys sp.]|jgi:hypothetical protein|nr:hypothetical protein [Pseudolabrys sp.]
MLTTRTDRVDERAITIDTVKNRPGEQSRDFRICKRCGGASVRVAFVAKSIDNLACEIFQCLDCESTEWVSEAERNLR